MTSIETPVLSAEQIAAALDATSSPWYPGSEITIRFGRFPGGSQAADGKWYMSKYGDNAALDFVTWEALRREAAARSWPDETEKLSLPYEVGAVLATESNGKARRRARDVAAFTWVFIDSDAGQPASQLRDALQALNICFLLTESATSRSEGKPLKWHLFLPLSEPKTLPSLNRADVEAAATLAASKEWWHRIHRHIAACMFTLGGLSQSADETAQQPQDDATASSLARLAYVPHRPAGGPPRHLIANEGRLLVLDDFLRATGFTDTEAPLVRIETVSPPRRGRNAAVTTQHLNLPPDEDDHGPTADETTGSLLYKALDFFGLAGPQIEPGKYRALCPWRSFHTATANHDPDGFQPNDSSVVFWTRDETSKPGGGWKCQHSGGGIEGQCAQSSAADVLRWARQHGCPLPDRAAWGGVSEKVVTQQSVAEVLTPSEPAVKAPSLPRPPAFPGAPAQGEPPKPPPKAAASAKPLLTDIEVTTDLLTMRRLAIQAIANHGSFYKVQGALFDLIEEDGEDRYGRPKRPWLRKTVAPHLTAELCAVSRWFTTKATKRGVDEIDQTPDRQAVGVVLAAGLYPDVRELNGIITTPVFRRGPDYSLVQTQGYDQSLGIIYRPAGYIPRISTNPGRPELDAALRKLRRIVADFPFKADDPDLGFSVWLSMIFTRLLRFTFNGNVPMFLISAGAAGSGKGKFIDSAAIIAEGVESWKRTKAGDDAEIERAIGAAVKEEVPIAVLDNIPRGVVLESATLEMYLTTPIFTTREIGTSKNIKGVKGGWTDTLWAATGNGLQTGGDMSRRVLRVDIEDRTGKPEQRPVQIPELESYCHAHRAELLAAALTLLSGFFAAKKAGWSLQLQTFASFEGWSIVREAVIWCGLPDPYLARGKADDDVDTGNFVYLVEHLRTLVGDREVGIGEISSTLIRDHAAAAPKHGAFYDFLSEAGVKLGRSEGAATSLGKFLQRFDKRVVPEGRWQLRHFRSGRGGRVQVVDVGGSK